MNQQKYKHVDTTLPIDFRQRIKNFIHKVKPNTFEDENLTEKISNRVKQSIRLK